MLKFCLNISTHPYTVNVPSNIFFFIYHFDSRPSGAILQFNLVPQPHPWSPPHTCDRLSQWPMFSAMGQKTPIHSGLVCGCAAGSGTVFKRIINRWVYWFQMRLSLIFYISYFLTSSLHIFPVFSQVFPLVIAPTTSQSGSFLLY